MKQAGGATTTEAKMLDPIDILLDEFEREAAGWGLRVEGSTARVEAVRAKIRAAIENGGVVS